MNHILAYFSRIELQIWSNLINSSPNPISNQINLTVESIPEGPLRSPDPDGQLTRAGAARVADEARLIHGQDTCVELTMHILGRAVGFVRNVDDASEKYCDWQLF